MRKHRWQNEPKGSKHLRLRRGWKHRISRIDPEHLALALRVAVVLAEIGIILWTADAGHTVARPSAITAVGQHQEVLK